MEKRGGAEAGRGRTEMLKLVRCWRPVQALNQRDLPIIAGKASNDAAKGAPLVQGARRPLSTDPQRRLPMACPSDIRNAACAR